MQRYSIIEKNNPREIILLRGSGCKWRKCTFCDYHLDFCRDEKKNFELNLPVIESINGIYKKLEVINSGSFCDLDEKTVLAIIEKCIETGITEIHFESHWMHKHQIADFKKAFSEKGIDVKMKIGVETFDKDFRETVLVKGINERDPEIIAENFDEVCLLFGINGQTVESMINDIETGLKYFERVCINIMCENSTAIKPDYNVISDFVRFVMPKYIENKRLDILIENTDFGVGGKQ